MDTDPKRAEKRLLSLASYHSSKPYQRQKCSLQKQLESYLWSLPGQKSLAMASPEDVLRFLVWRDKFGKTLSHLPACPTLRGQEFEGHCLCSKGLAAGMIDNNIGKLRSIFKENGRGSSWNEDLHLGNPAAHPSVKRYQSLVLEEQTIARTFPTQAIPIFLDKLRAICLYLRDRTVHPIFKAI